MALQGLSLFGDGPPFGQRAGQEVDPKSASRHLNLQTMLAGLFHPKAANFSRRLLAYDPAAELAKVRVPIFILNGQKDIQISPTLDAQLLYNIADLEGGKATLHLSPDADHVLKTEPRPMSELTPTIGLEYNKNGRRLDKDAAAAIVSWLKDQTKNQKNRQKSPEHRFLPEPR